jgi:hypothetical protein
MIWNARRPAGKLAIGTCALNPPAQGIADCKPLSVM